MEQEEKTVCEKIITSVETKMEELNTEGIKQTNVDYLYKLVDIHKDLKNEKYWKEKIMRYNNYGTYSNDMYGARRRDSRGRYMGDSYGRRGVKGTGRGRYRGEDMLDEAMEHYSNYSDSMENYGAEDSETMASFKHMIKSLKEFYHHLKQEAVTPEQMEMLEDTAREMIER